LSEKLRVLDRVVPGHREGDVRRGWTWSEDRFVRAVLYHDVTKARREAGLGTR
jgi:hypothetical protein